MRWNLGRSRPELVVDQDATEAPPALEVLGEEAPRAPATRAASMIGASRNDSECDSSSGRRRGRGVRRRARAARILWEIGDWGRDIRAL
jgi:hypothetical protein